MSIDDEKRVVCSLYPDYRPWDLEPHYGAHVGGMTEFRLHRKSDIALQLAWRDKEISRLRDAVAKLAYSGPCEVQRCGK